MEQSTESSLIQFQISHCNRPVKKLSFIGFGASVKQNSCNYLKKLLEVLLFPFIYICVRLDFLHMLQPKQHSAAS